jgi:sugar transferase (PEP-CTERM/EpsH1 system associated)
LEFLFLANRLPYPPYRGDKLKIYNLAKRIGGAHKLHLITFSENSEDEKYIPKLEEIFETVQVIPLPKWRSYLNCLFGIFSIKPFQVLYFKSNKMQKTVNKFLENNKVDSVHVQHLRMAQYLEENKSVARILDLPDAFSLYWKRRMKTKRKFVNRVFDYFESKRVIRYEKVLEKFDMSLVCSVEDQEFLKDKHGTDNINLLPNGVDLTAFGQEIHDYSHSNRILFTGNMDYAPNVDGVCFFVEEIFPKILSRFPESKFIIAGQRPVQKVRNLASENVEVTGFIEDLSKEYNKASVVVAPLRFGAGTQNKVLEAMATGVPVVCSEIGFKGLGVKSGEGVIMQQNSNDFAESVISILQSEEKRKSMGETGKKIIQDNFDWDNISLKLVQYLTDISK